MEQNMEVLTKIVFEYGFLQYDHENRFGTKADADAAKEKVCNAVNDFSNGKTSFAEAMTAIYNAVR